jgi:hypothetical protein
MHAAGGALCRPPRTTTHARWSIAVPWYRATTILDRMACHARGQRGGRSRRCLYLSRNVVVEFVHEDGVERAQIYVAIFGRRATRALKALRASMISLRPRCARLTALIARIAIRFLATIDGRRTQTCLTTLSDGATV